MAQTNRKAIPSADVAPDVEKAIHRVREFLVRWRDLLTPEAGRQAAITRHLIPPLKEMQRISAERVPLLVGENAIYDAVDTAKLISLARAGDDTAHAALCQIVRYKYERGQPLDYSLGAYVLERLEVAAHPRKSGKKGHDHLSRDLELAMAVSIARKLGFNKTRNPTVYAHESACSIVSKALATMDIHITEGAVQKAVDHWRHLE